MTFESDDIVDTGATENTAAEVETQTEEWQPEQPNDGEETEAEQSDEEEAKQEAEQESKKKNRAQERIQQLARERAELKRELDEYKAKLEAPKATDAAPRIEDFEDYSEYLQAQQDFFVEQAENRVLQKLKAEQEQKEQVERQVQFETAVNELRDEGIDVESLVKKADELPPLPITLDQFGLSPKETLSLAADIIQNDELYIELSQMNQVQAAMRIGQIIGAKQPSKAAPKIPNTPKPIQPTSANAPVARNPAAMSDDEWYRQELKSRKGK